MFSDDEKKVIEFLRTELHRSIRHIQRNSCENFKKTDAELLETIKNCNKKIEDKIIRNYLQEMFRHVVDIEDETVNISFYNQQNFEL